MTWNLKRDQPNGLPLRAQLAPIVLVRVGAEGGDRIGAFGGELIPLIAPPSVPDPPTGTIRFGRRSWLADLLSRWLPEVEVVSRLQPLEPAAVPPSSFVLPVWAVGRANNLPPEPIEAVLKRVAAAIDDPEFPTRAMASIRRTLVSDPFATRLLSDESRMRAASEESLVDADDPGVPPIIALLPERFTLGQLQAVAAGLLGRTPDELESGSNFRRRTQELVHRRVLVEDESAATGHERGGRPPRRFEFNGDAWKSWKLERFGGPGRGAEAAVVHLRGQRAGPSEAFRELESILARTTRRLEAPSESAYRQVWEAAPEMVRSRVAGFPWAIRDQETAESLESTHQRIERMERMIQALYRQSQESRPKP